MLLYPFGVAWCLCHCHGTLWLVTFFLRSSRQRILDTQSKLIQDLFFWCGIINDQQKGGTYQVLSCAWRYSCIESLWARVEPYSGAVRCVVEALSVSVIFYWGTGSVHNWAAWYYVLPDWKRLGRYVSCSQLLGSSHVLGVTAAVHLPANALAVFLWCIWGTLREIRYTKRTLFLLSKVAVLAFGGVAWRIFIERFVVPNECLYCGSCICSF